jgi:hypothetical protein
LQDLFKVSAPAWRGARAAEDSPAAARLRNQVGQGRVVYIPEIKPAVAKPPAARMSSQYWKLPVNWKEFVDEVRWAAGGSLSLELDAPLTVVSELVQQKERSRFLVHLLNYDAQRTPSLKPIAVSLKVADGAKIRSVRLLSPDDPNPPAPQFAIRDGRLRFTVSRLQTYTLAVVEMERP